MTTMEYIFVGCSQSRCYHNIRDGEVVMSDEETFEAARGGAHRTAG